MEGGSAATIERIIVKTNEVMLLRKDAGVQKILRSAILLESLLRLRIIA
jgi:hypothetical protein